MNLRVIAGKYRHRHLKVVENSATRPTKDRVKEALFSILQTKVVNATCLDLFAGSGALGIEALSRGSLTCYFNELNNQSYKLLKENLMMIEEKVYIFQQDYFTLLKQLPPATFDIIFLDPPYDFAIDQVLTNVLQSGICKDDGVLVLETRKETQIKVDHATIKKYKYGETHLTIIWRII